MKVALPKLQMMRAEQEGTVALSSVFWLCLFFAKLPAAFPSAPYRSIPKWTCRQLTDTISCLIGPKHDGSGHLVSCRWLSSAGNTLGSDAWHNNPLPAQTPETVHGKKQISMTTLSQATGNESLLELERCTTPACDPIPSSVAPPFLEGQPSSSWAPPSWAPPSWVLVAGQAPLSAPPSCTHAPEVDAIAYR